MDERRDADQLSDPIRDPANDATVGGGKVGRTAEVAKSAAGDVASTAGDEAKRVAGEAANQARSVIEEAKGQVSGLAGQARDELRAQAADRGQQAAQGLRTLSDQLGALSEGRPQEAGPLTDYLGEARSKVSSYASRLDDRGFEGVLHDVGDFARRRPGVFLAAALGAGFLAGRLVRSGAGSTGEPDSSNGNGQWPTPSASVPMVDAPQLVVPPTSPVAPSMTGVHVP